MSFYLIKSLFTNAPIFLFKPFLMDSLTNKTYTLHNSNILNILTKWNASIKILEILIFFLISTEYYNMKRAAIDTLIIYA